MKLLKIFWCFLKGLFKILFWIVLVCGIIPITCICFAIFVGGDEETANKFKSNYLDIIDELL